MTTSPPKRRPGAFRRTLLLIRSNWISTLGGLIAFFGIVAMVTALLVPLTGRDPGPYDAIVTYLALPIIGLIGLVLIPLGLMVYRRHLGQRLEELADKPISLARAVAAVTIVNLAAILLASREGLEFASSNRFCGQACHVQMQPEDVTFRDSPHAQIKCVDCHIGPSAEEQLAAKLNGIHQLKGVIVGDWQRPIPVPIHGLPSAKDSCGKCHPPNQYLGVKLKVHSRFRDDQDVSGYTNVLLMRTGGTHPNGRATGIHWHTNPNVLVEYVAADAQRMQIPWVRTVREDGTEQIFTTDGVAPEAPPEGHFHVMECTECHNRTGHDFDDPADAVDRAIAAGLIPRSLPWVKKVAVDVLHTEFARVSAERGIRDALFEEYEELGLVDERTRPLIEATADQLAKIWLRNIYPERAQLWNTYVDLKSHAGCFRCHDGQHTNATGETITNRCDACHVVLSEEEEDPAILETLGIGAGR